MAAAALWSDELLQVSRLEVRFIEGGTEQTRRQRGRAPREIWRRVKQLGQGGFATVYLEQSDTSEATLRAVKQLRKAVGPGKIDYRRELEAAALFSHEKNLLVCQAGPDWWIKVTDFGISKRATSGDTTLRTHAYTEQYAAPEVRIGEGSYTRAVDIWSTGVITYNLLTARATPLSSAELWRYYHQSENFPTERLIELGVGEAASRFVAQLLSSVPENRPAAKECLQHEWLGAAVVRDHGPSEIPVVQDILPEINALTMISEGEQYARWTTQESGGVQEDYPGATSVPEGSDRMRGEDQPQNSDTVTTLIRHSSLYLPQDEKTETDIGPVETWSPSLTIPHTTRSWLRLGKQEPSRVLDLAFSTDGTRLASGLDDGSIRLWDPATGALLKTLRGHSGWVFSIAFSQDSTRLASGSGDRTIRLWDVSLSAPLKTIKGHTDEIKSVAFSPDGKRLLSGSSDKTVRLWNAATGALLRTLEGHSSIVWSVAFSPDGTRLASGGVDLTVRLWNAATGALLQTLEGHSRPVSSVAFSPNSTRIASASSDTFIRLWDVAAGVPLQTLTGNSRSVRSIAFSLDGTRLASGSHDMTVRLWNAATGVLLQTLKGHSGKVYSVAFSPDSTQLASGSGDGTVRLWGRDAASEL